MYDSSNSGQTRANFDTQLLKQNQNLSLQVYQLNNQLLKNKEVAAKTKHKLEKVCTENGQLTTEIV